MSRNYIIDCWKQAWKAPRSFRENAGLVVFQQPELDHYQRFIESACSRLADLELEYGVANSKVVSVRSKLFGALRPYYQERDRLRLLIQYRVGD